MERPVSEHPDFSLPMRPKWRHKPARCLSNDCGRLEANSCGPPSVSELVLVLGVLAGLHAGAQTGG